VEIHRGHNKYKRSGKLCLIRAGTRIAETEEELRNFYKWFGDSKGVDERGCPKVVGHYVVFFTLVGDFSQALAGEDSEMKFQREGEFILSAVDKRLDCIICVPKARYEKTIDFVANFPYRSTIIKITLRFVWTKRVTANWQ